MSTATVSRGTMPLAGHVREARRRATRAAVALVAGVVAGYLLSEQILDLLRAPITEIAASRAASLNYDTVTSAFDLRLKIAVYAGIVLSSPVWLAELFAFVTPGLTRRERRYGLGFLAAAVPLFVAGCGVGYLLFPRMVHLLLGFSSSSDSTILTATYYVDFVLKFVIAIGVAFVLPVFVVLLNRLGIVSAATLRRGWRVIVVVIVLFSALVTPAADVLSMFFVAAPMAGLFGLALGIAQLHDARLADPARSTRTSRSTPCSD